MAKRLKSFIKGVTVRFSDKPYEQGEDGEDIRRSIRAREQANWNRILDAFENKTKDADATHHHILLEHTPEVLKRLGVKDLPITVMGGVIHKIIGNIRNSEYDYHKIPIKELRNLLIDLDNPVAVFDSVDRPNSLVVLTNITDKNGNLKSIVPLKLDRAASGKSREHVIVTAFGQTTSTLQIWIDSGYLLKYVNKKALKKSAQRLLLPRDSILKTQGVLTENDFSSEQLGQIIPDFSSGVKGVEGEKESTNPIISFRNPRGEVVGTYNRETNEIVVYPGADADTIGHELCGHATWQYAEQQAKKGNDSLLKKMQEVVDSPTAKPVWEEVQANYDGEKNDVQREEVWAHIMGHQTSKAIEEIQKSRSGRRWYQRFLGVFKDVWEGLKSAIGLANKIRTEGTEKMTPNEFVEYLINQMLERRTLGEIEKEDGGGERKSKVSETSTSKIGKDKKKVDNKEGGISHIFTGSAANYDKPNLLAIGTGEGNQVYGWGLYGSNKRGVAEGYAELAKDKTLERKEESSRYTWQSVITKNGQQPNSKEERAASAKLEHWGSLPKAIKMVQMDIDDGLRTEENKAILQELKEHGAEYDIPHMCIYEQTFFTNREEGDESHLLKWYEPISEENKKRVVEAIVNPVIEKLKTAGQYSDEKKDKLIETWSKEIGDRTGEELYRFMVSHFGSPKDASIALAKADIDGIKYPVDSYKKAIKDGDDVGWDYVSFRDDNIRIDKKYVDGEKIYDYEELMEKNHKGIDSREVLSYLTKLASIEEMQAEFARIMGSGKIEKT